uniref:Uncharacterized protein n=1 Tax=Panagrolaimus davidi TaxID=227884 RepID=A0A914QSR4_9BILA
MACERIEDTHTTTRIPLIALLLFLLISSYPSGKDEIILFLEEGREESESSSTKRVAEPNRADEVDRRESIDGPRG